MSVRGKVVGIVGGMGPLATVDLLRKIIAATPARRDQDHLRILVDSDPSVPDRTDALLRGGRSPVRQLVAMARRLEAAGAQLLAMPCNTAHAFIAEISRGTKAPFVDMIHETAEEIGRRGFLKVGILASTGTVRSRVYHRELAAGGIRVQTPDVRDQKTVMEIIYAIKAGKPVTRRMQERLEGVAGRLKRRGCEAVVAACTELPLAIRPGSRLRWIDPTEVLARAIVRNARARGLPAEAPSRVEGAKAGRARSGPCI